MYQPKWTATKKTGKYRTSKIIFETFLGLVVGGCWGVLLILVIIQKTEDMFAFTIWYYKHMIYTYIWLWLYIYICQQLFCWEGFRVKSRSLPSLSSKLQGCDGMVRLTLASLLVVFEPRTYEDSGPGLHHDSHRSIERKKRVDSLFHLPGLMIGKIICTWFVWNLWLTKWYCTLLLAILTWWCQTRTETLIMTICNCHH